MPTAPTTPATIYSTGFYKKTGIRYCAACGEKYRTQGNPPQFFCPSGTPTGCPWVIPTQSAAPGAPQQQTPPPTDKGTASS